MFQVGNSPNTFPADPSQGPGRRFLRNQHNKRRMYQRLGIKVSGCEGLCSGSSWRNDLGVKTAHSSAGLFWQVFKRWRPELRIQKDNSVPITRVCRVNVHFLIVSMIVEMVSPCVCQQRLQPVIPLPCWDYWQMLLPLAHPLITQEAGIDNGLGSTSKCDSGYPTGSGTFS